MTPAQYIFINKGLGMSTGKAAAQAAHAAVNAYEATPDNNVKRVWWRGGHHMKLVMECRDSEHLRDTERYLNDRGFKTSLILDEGHTEVDPITPTALGVEILDKDDAHVKATFSSFKLYRDRPAIVIEKGALTPDEFNQVRIWAADGWDSERINEWLRRRRANERRRFWQR